MDGKNEAAEAAEAAKLERAARLRLERDWALTMSERLARVHELCRQMTLVASSRARER